MKVGELKGMLEAYDDDLEVRLVTQPTYAMEYGISGVNSMEEVIADIPKGDARDDFLSNDTSREWRERIEEDIENVFPERNIVYILEGEWKGYGTSRLWTN